MSEAPSAAPSDEPPAHDRVLDVGDILCGELAVLLRKELKAMQPGQVLEVVARDAAAPQDLPAWCSMTGHALVHAQPPHFWIRRRED
jgi:tRNA 2-thiouridine synthesizing protein A